jgi:DNA-binding transcriptional MerR regulator
MAERMYKIGEAARELDLKTHVLRFWETEFPEISPVRTDKGQRLYRESDLELLKLIRALLHERGLTIEGARRVLRSRAALGEAALGEAALGEAALADLSRESDKTGEEMPVEAKETSAASSKLQYALKELKSISDILHNAL